MFRSHLLPSLGICYKNFKNQCKCKIVSFKLYGLNIYCFTKYRLNFCSKFKWGTNVPCSYCAACRGLCELVDVSRTAGPSVLPAQGSQSAIMPEKLRQIFFAYFYVSWRMSQCGKWKLAQFDSLCSVQKTQVTSPEGNSRALDVRRNVFWRGCVLQLNWKCDCSRLKQW